MFTPVRLHSMLRFMVTVVVATVAVPSADEGHWQVRRLPLPNSGKIADYAWLPNGKIITFPTGQSNPIAYSVSEVDGSQAREYELHGRKQKPRQRNAKAGDDPVAGTIDPAGFDSSTCAFICASPDGKSLLWKRRESVFDGWKPVGLEDGKPAYGWTGHDEHTLVFSDLTGSELSTTIAISTDAYNHGVVWTGGASWIEFADGVRSTTLQLRAPSYARLNDDASPVTFQCWGEVIGSAGPNSILVADTGGERFFLDTIEIKECTLAPKPALRTIGSVKFPFVPHHLSASLSPDRKTIAWLVTFVDDSDPDPVLRAVGHPFPSRAKCRVYLSNIEGKGLPFASEQILPGGAFQLMSSRFQAPHSLQWTPNGRQVSYLYEGHLWIADVK